MTFFEACSLENHWSKSFFNTGKHSRNVKYTVMRCASMFGDEQTICDRVLVCRSSILTAKNTELKLGSKFELSVEVEIVP